MDQALFHRTLLSFVENLNRNFEHLNEHFVLYEEKEKRTNGYADSFEEYFDDWAQANWELLVERVVCRYDEFLVSYGNGSDYESMLHDRVFFHNAEPTHKVVCSSKNEIVDYLSGEIVELSDYEFECFVSAHDKIYSITPPFEHILLSKYGESVCGEDGIRYFPLEQLVVVPIMHIAFSAHRIINT
ncbi:hypothetical protein [Vibrio bivalvicida]|uniref:Uncharacterized protein n=1 Tax=Vibrio bivalvicida TaxID=1276888 RepID=A0A177XX07_9VIBR|nr:hypothetical protein [Vibrio bivalvicida]OAJ93108.1 hypothetical protein APB76_16545 [Vibrio bivalvicida]